MTLSFPVSFEIIAGNEAQSQGQAQSQNRLRNEGLYLVRYHYKFFNGYFRLTSGANVHDPFSTGYIEM